jgi:Cu/Zn superoxide dismutase
MLKPDVSSIGALMKRSATRLVGQVSVASNDEAAFIKQLFGFLPQDVEGIHLHKDGEGKGVWFRLKDGRVFDKLGKPSSADRAIYDKV